MRLCALLLFLSLWLPLPAGAADDLYTGVAPVLGQGEAERRSAAPDALIHVLQKLSGRWDVPNDPALGAAFDNIERMMLAFRYEEVERMLPDGETEQALQLVVQFLPSAVDQLVRDMQLPRWRTDRRPVVLWVIVEDLGRRELMPLEYQYAWDRMEQVAALRGLEVAWPALGEELRDQLDLQLLWGGYTDQLLVEGADSDGVAIVAARREGPEWSVRWTFADGSASLGWRTRDRDLAVALTEGMHRLTDEVAVVQSIGPAGLGVWRSELLVAGLGGAADYARCLAYLQDLGVVDRVDLVSLRGREARFALALNADPSYLQASIGRDGLLAFDETADLYRLVR